MQAFDCPLLQDVAYNCNGNAIAKLEGDRKVQYGILVENLSPRSGSLKDSKLVVADKECVQHPLGQSWSLRTQYDLVKIRVSEALRTMHLRRPR